MNKIEINSLDILSIAKLYSIFFFIISFIPGIYTSLSHIYQYLSDNSKYAPTFGTRFYWILLALIAYPIGAAIGGFLSGLIASLIYNLLAKFVGGVKISTNTIEESTVISSISQPVSTPTTV